MNVEKPWKIEAARERFTAYKSVMRFTSSHHLLVLQVASKRRGSDLERDFAESKDLAYAT